MLPDTLKISAELQTNTFGGKNVTFDQVFGDTHMVNTDCYGHRNMSWEWINLSQAKVLIIFKCVIPLFLDTTYRLHFSEKEEIMMVWLSEEKQYFKFAFEA